MIRVRFRAFGSVTTSACLLLSVALGVSPAPARAEDAPTPVLVEPGAMMPAAQARYDEGLRLYAARDFAAAIRSFEDGFALEPRREFLFAEAQAFRLAGDCARATDLYRRFLQTEPSAIQIEATNMGLDRCAKQQAATTATAGERAAPASALVKPPAPADPDRAAKGDEPARAKDRPPRWWLDPLGLGATTVGVVGLGVGAGYLIAARGTASDANARSTPTYAEHLRLWGIAEDRQKVGLIALGAGAAALGAGVARLWFVRSRAHAAEAARATSLTLVPSYQAASVFMQGWF